MDEKKELGEVDIGDAYKSVELRQKNKKKENKTPVIQEYARSREGG